MLIFALHLSSSLMRKYILYTHAPSLSPITHRREHAYNCLIPDIVWKPEFWEHLKFGPSISTPTQNLQTSRLL